MMRRAITTLCIAAFLVGALPVAARAHTTNHVVHTATCANDRTSTGSACTTEHFAGGIDAVLWAKRILIGGTFQGVNMYVHHYAAGWDYDGSQIVCMRYHKTSDSVPQWAAIGHVNSGANVDDGAIVGLYDEASVQTNVIDYWWYEDYTVGDGSWTPAKCQTLDPGRGSTSTGAINPQFSWSPAQPASNQTVTFAFNATGSNYPSGTECRWSFDDGATWGAWDAPANATHIFTSDGDYYVRLDCRKTGTTTPVYEDREMVGVGGGAVGGTANQQQTCGAWWHIACYIGNALKALFVPSSTTTSDLGALWGDIKTKLPFSLIVDALTFIPSELQAFADKLAYDTGPNVLGQIRGGCRSILSGGQANEPLGNNIFSGTPLDTGNAPADDRVCPGELTQGGTAGMGELLGIVRTALWWGMLIALALGVWRMGAKVLA